jgi:DNA repair protein RecO (recombination protein O)
MHQHYRTKGFVLAKKNSGEADQIFVLYTQDFGKIEVVGKATRKITSKLKSSIDVFYFIEVEFIQGKKQKILTDAILLNKFPAILKNEKKINITAQIFQIIEKLTTNEARDEKVWSLIVSVVEKLLAPDINNSEMIFHYFLWNFFSLLGYSPELYSCPICLKKLLPETFFLSPHYGGVVCWQCCKQAKEESQQFSFNEITVNTVKLIRFLVKQPIETIQRLNSCQNDLQDLLKASDVYFDFLVKS